MTVANNADRQYDELVKRILSEGVRRTDRTGTGTLSVFGHQMRFDLSEGFPLLTKKRVPFRILAEELFWFLSGSTDIRPLLDKGVDIWTRDAYREYKEMGGDLSIDEFREFVKKGGWDLGRIYSAQWRRWRVGADWGDYEIDQIANVIESIRSNPESRRHIVTAWNPGELDEMALPPCHTMFQFYVADGKLSCHLFQRSGDVFLGVPFNIASYALLTHLIASLCELEVGEFVHTISDAHIYLDHVELVREQIAREPKALPTLHVIPEKSIDDFSIDSVYLSGYDPHPPIKGRQSF